MLCKQLVVNRFTQPLVGNCRQKHLLVYHSTERFLVEMVSNRSMAPLSSVLDLLLREIRLDAFIDDAVDDVADVVAVWITVVWEPIMKPVSPSLGVGPFVVRTIPADPINPICNMVPVPLFTPAVGPDTAANDSTVAGAYQHLIGDVRERAGDVQPIDRCRSVVAWV